MVHHLCAVDSFQVHPYLLGVEYLVAQQNLDEQILDEVLTFLYVEPLANQLDVVVDAVLHQLRMDCYLDVVDAEPHHQLKMDCYLDVGQVALSVLQLHRLQVHLMLRQIVLAPLQLVLPALDHVML
jgi:hypothetical protein